MLAVISIMLFAGCNNVDTKSNIKKVSASKVNTYYTNDFTKEGAYRIEAKGQSAVVIVAPQDSVKSISSCQTPKQKS